MTDLEPSATHTVPVGTCGVQAALLCSAWLIFQYNVWGWGWQFAACLALATLLLDWVLYRPETWFHRVLQWSAILGILALASHQLTYLIARGWDLSDGFGRAAHFVLLGLGYQTSFESGLVGVESHEGLVRFLASPEKTGLYWALLLLIVWSVLYWIRSPQPRLLPVIMLTVLAAILLVLRQTLVYVLIIENDHILQAGAGFNAMAMISFGLIPSLALLLVGGLIVARYEFLGKLYSGDLHNQIDFQQSAINRPWAMVVLCLAFVGGFFHYVLPAGSQKAGRVLVDDKLCGQWEPTARLLDTEWYGDFSTYSFSSLTEWLGCHFLVDVNTSLEYTPEVLSQYDVVVIKTPESSLRPSEAEAIRNWVNAGGGLLLVGDHTNLMGTSTRLNQITDGWGIELNYDAVSSGGGGFNYVRRNVAANHPAFLDGKDILFMTSCSLSADLWSDLVIVDPDSSISSHDYAGSSFFSDPRYFPEKPYGPAVLCATRDVGKGRVAVFTDSTVWSSFAFFQYGRSDLLLGLVNYLNYESTWGKMFARVLGLVLTMATIVCVVYFRSTNTLVIAVVSIISGVLCSDAINPMIYPRPQAQRELREVVFVHQGGMCAFPQTLGGTGNLEAIDAFDTFFVATQRLGLVPRIAYAHEDTFSSTTKVVVYIRPVVPPPADHLLSLRQFINSGGEVIVIDSLESGRVTNGVPLARSLGFELSLSQGEHGEPSIGLPPGAEQMIFSPRIVGGRMPIGKGHITYVTGASQFSREVLGHCFTVPRRESRVIYETIYKLFEPVKFEIQDRRTYGLR